MNGSHWLTNKWLLMVMIVIVFIILSWMNSLKVCDEIVPPTGFAKKAALIGLELSHSPSEWMDYFNAPYIGNGQEGPCVQEKKGFVKEALCRDFLFIVAYILLLSLLVFNLLRAPVYRILGVIISVLIGVLDIIENTFTFKIISLLGEHSMTDSTRLSRAINLEFGFSFSKWMLCFLLVLYLFRVANKSNRVKYIGLGLLFLGDFLFTINLRWYINSMNVAQVVIIMNVVALFVISVMVLLRKKEIGMGVSESSTVLRFSGL